MAALAVIGLGNPLAGDEGIGVRLIAEIEKHFDCAETEVRDLGTSLYSLLHVLPGKTKVVIVDCALMGEKPGTIRRFTREEARSRKAPRHWSLHEGDVFAVVDLATRTGGSGLETVFFGIEPEQMELGRGLSAGIEKRIPEYLDRIAAEAGLGKKVAPDA